MELSGTVKYFQMGSGAWGLITDDGTQYELIGPLPPSLSDGQRITLKGELKPNAVSMAMIGKVIMVKEIES